MLGRFFKRDKAPRKSGRRRALIGVDRWIGLLFLLLAVFVYFWGPAPVEILQSKVFDAYQRLKPREIPQPQFKPVTIIDLDEGSLSEYGQWPWPRTLVGELVQKTMSAGAILVAFDMVFAEPDRMSPKDIAESVIRLDQETRERLRMLPSNDLVFADVIKRSRVVLGQAGYRLKQRKHTSEPLRTSVAIRGPDPTPIMPEFPELVRNIDTIEKVAAGRGIFSLQPERDGIVRRVQALFRHEGKLYPTLTIEMLRVAFGNRTIVAFSDEAGVSAVGVASARQFPPKGLKLPTDRRGRIWPYFSESDEAKYVPARDILNGSVDEAMLKGKFTILGTSAVGLLDVRSTPVSEIIPGVEVHAQIIEAAFTGNFLLRPNTIELFEYLLLLLVGLMMIWLVPRASAHWTALFFLVIAGAAMGTSWYLFAEQHILFDVASCGPHFGEEAPLSGSRGSGTIFFSWCNMRCLYCQNWDISWRGDGDKVSAAELAAIMLRLQAAGCHNINFVSPSHVVAQILEALVIAATAGLRLPLVYNTGGFDSAAALALLDGVIDIYMPDAKYADAAVARRHSKIRDYPVANRAALREMHRQVGDLQLDAHGLARRGLLVRHLVLPNGLAGTERVLRFLAEEISRDTYLNVMGQYRPCYRAGEHEELSRPPSRGEMAAAFAAAAECGLTRLDARI